MWHKNKIAKEKDNIEYPELVLSSPEGAPWFSFPLSVVNPIRLLISRVGRKGEIPPRLSFTAALRREGVSYVCWAFATTLAYDFETSVCVVDLNWYWPSVLSTKFSAYGGLGAVLAGDTPLKRAVIPTRKSNLAVLPAGSLIMDQRPHFARSAVLKETLLELNKLYDHLVLDVPAVLASNDAIPLASLGTAFCLVIHQGVTSIEEVKSALRDLDHIANMGVVLNRYRSKTPEFILKLMNSYSIA